MNEVATLYTDEFIEHIQKYLPNFNEFYENPSEGIVGFDFNDYSIELSTSYAERADPEFLKMLLKTLGKSDDDFTLPATEDVRAIAHTWVLGYYERRYNEGLSSNDIHKEQQLAQKALDRIHMLNHCNTKTKTTEITSITKLKLQYLLAIMNSFDTKNTSKTDDHEFNKQNEKVFTRNISHEGKPIGAIKYIETDSDVTILRSDIDTEYQGRGLATEAYKALIDDKIANGKVVHSDNIVSLSAQKVYSRLESEGYEVRKQPSRINHRQALMSLTPDNIRKQRDDFPVVYKDGVGMTESGYRLKGAPIYSVVKSPNVALNISPIRIGLVDNKTFHEKVFEITPHSIKLSEKTDMGLSEFDAELSKKINNLFEEAKNALSSPENQDIKERLSADNVTIWKNIIIERSEIEQALNRTRDQSPELSF
jgi:predicted GNAT family acetyltransferase